VISASALGQAILALLCYDEKNCLFLASRVDPNLFQGRVNQKIAKAAIAYIEEYRLPPGDQLELLLENDLRRGDEGILLGKILDSLPEQYATLQPEFVLSELNTWEEAEQINQAATSAMEAVARGDVEFAKKELTRQRKLTKIEDPGIWLSDPIAMLRNSDNTIEEFFSSGVEAIDKLNLIPQRKTIACWMASTGRGKTWAMVNETKAGIQYGKTTLVITLELSQEKFAGRLVQALFSLSKYEAKEVRVAFFSNGVIDYRTIVRSSVVERREEILRRLGSALSWPRVLIKEYPTGMFSLTDLQLLLDRLDKDYSFIPDQIILDAPHNMAVDANNLRISLGRLWIGLRGLAVERNTALICSAQSNRPAKDSKLIDEGDISEDWSIAGTVDALYTHNQTTQEKEVGLCRLLVAKYRDEADKVIILNSQSYAIGQFSLDSVLVKNLRTED
jgi:hypothetical protein